jgi:hypothetical protein
MSEQVMGELKKLSDIVTDPALDPDIRIKSIQQISRIGTYEALVALLDLAANEQLPVKERDTALKYAREVLKKTD